MHDSAWRSGTSPPRCTDTSRWTLSIESAMIVDAVAAPPAALISMSIRTVLTRCLLPICLGLHGIFCIAIEPASTVSASGATTLPLAAAGDVEEVPGASSASEQRGFATYANARYGYSIAYPDDLLTPGKEADDGDGLAFSAKTGGARVAVWGRYNATDDTPVALLQGEEEGGLQWSTCQLRSQQARSCRVFVQDGRQRNCLREDDYPRRDAGCRIIHVPCSGTGALGAHHHENGRFPASRLA